MFFKIQKIFESSMYFNKKKRKINEFVNGNSRSFYYDTIVTFGKNWGMKKKYKNIY